MKVVGRLVAMVLCLCVIIACGGPRTRRVCGVLYAELVEPGETAHLLLIDPESGVEYTLLATDAAVFNGGLSPDGTQVLCTWRDATGWGDTCIMPLDGSEPRPLVSSATPLDAGAARWSFDGRKAVCNVYIGNATYPNTDDFYVVDVASGTPTKLPVRGWASAWSPIDSRIAILCSFREDWGVWVFDTDTGETKRMLQGVDMREPELAWSPDAKQIAVVAGTGVEYILVVDVESGEGRAVTRTDSYEYRQLGVLAWPPNGDKIAFIEREASGTGAVHGTDSLFVADVETGEETWLAEEAFWGRPRWSPDGSEIAFGGRAPDDAFGPIYRVQVSTGQVTQLSDRRGLRTLLAWDCVTLAPQRGR